MENKGYKIKGKSNVGEFGLGFLGESSNYGIVEFEDKGNFAYVVLDFIDFVGELYKALISDEDFRKSVEKYVQEK